VLVVRVSNDAHPRRSETFIEGFAAQIALLVEREQLRAAGEREKLWRNPRSSTAPPNGVSHELKTPLPSWVGRRSSSRRR